jgi:hypothetical protein
LLVVTHIETGTSFGVRRMRAILVTRPRSGKPPVWETPVREGFETNSTICHCVPAQVYILASTPADRHIRSPLGFEIGVAPTKTDSGGELKHIGEARSLRAGTPSRVPARAARAGLTPPLTATGAPPQTVVRQLLMQLLRSATLASET